MNKETRVQAHNVELPLDDVTHLTIQRAYAGDTLFTEGMPGSHMYVIKEGEVDLYLVRDEKRVVIATLGKNQCFGMPSKIAPGKRTECAAAKTYCELYLVSNESFNAQVQGMPKLVAGMLNTQADIIARSSEVIASRINYRSDIVIYAQLLHLMGQGALGGKSDGRSPQPLQATVPLRSVFSSARILLGHSDTHIRNVVGKLVMLHLIQLDEAKDGSKCLVFSPADIVTKAAKIGAADKDLGKLEFEYLNLDEFAAMVEVDRSALLQKLARSELTEDLFTFRRSAVVGLLNEKGKKFFVERRVKSPEEFVDILDIEFADQRTAFEVLGRVDIFDLAKVMCSIESEEVKNKIMASLSQQKQLQLASDMEGLSNIDPVEVMQLGKSIINAIKEKMLAKRL